MRVTKAKAAENRARVVAEAARLFGDRGLDGVGVADLMRAAGFTHGGFYNHFSSKQDLAAEAVSHAFAEAVARLERRAREATGKRRRQVLADYVDRYLAPQSRDAPGPRCPMAALGTDAARGGPKVRQAFAAGIECYIEAFAPLAAPAHPAVGPPPRRRAIAVLAALVGGLTLARAVGRVDLSDEILAAVRTALVGSAPEDGPAP